LSDAFHAFRVALPNFEGPLDLLLHLIKEHEVDIFDIPIALITEKYVEHLDRMREVNLEIAGEFLVMAATLAHIKSRLLLPREEVRADPEAESEAQDPRAELVKRLLEYQKYKEAAESLGQRSVLDRDVFPRRVSVEKVPIPDDEVGFVEVSVYKLIEALDRVLETARPEIQHKVVRERISLSNAIRKVAETLRDRGEVSFYELFEGVRFRHDIIITFLAMLEMCKHRLVHVFQDESQEIRIRAREGALENVAPPEVNDNEYK
jgi:segregation and condensation protein A